MALKYKVGNKVRIKSLDWYNENKDESDIIDCGERCFTHDMISYCGKILTVSYIIESEGCYEMANSDYRWTDEMIEGLAEEEGKKEVIAWMPNGKLIAEKFNDGTVTTIIDKFKYNKLPINSEFFDDKVELVISPDFELKQESNKWFVVKKKNKYPKTYEECCKIMGVNHTNELDICEHCDYKTEITYYEDSLLEKIEVLYRLIICRDAYWKIAGEEMGLGKPWEPDWSTKYEHKYVIEVYCNNVRTNVQGYFNTVLAFPTKEMRDAFYENFKDLIEQCKELL